MSLFVLNFVRNSPFSNFKQAPVPDLVESMALGAFRDFKQLSPFIFPDLRPGLFWSLFLSLSWDSLSHFTIRVSNYWTYYVPGT